MQRITPPCTRRVRNTGREDCLYRSTVEIMVVVLQLCNKQHRHGYHGESLTVISLLSRNDRVPMLMVFSTANCRFSGLPPVLATMCLVVMQWSKNSQSFPRTIALLNTQKCSRSFPRILSLLFPRIAFCRILDLQDAEVGSVPTFEASPI